MQAPSAVSLTQQGSAFGSGSVHYLNGELTIQHVPSNPGPSSARRNVGNLSDISPCCNHIDLFNVEFLSVPEQRCVHC